MRQTRPSTAGGTRVFSLIFIIIGCTLMLLCGSCTAYWGGIPAWDLVQCQMPSPTYNGCNEALGLAPSLIIISLIVGGIPTLLGIGMTVMGVLVWRRDVRAAKTKPPPEPPPEQIWS